MARSFTLGALVTRAKNLVEREGNSYITDTMWKEWLSSVYAQLCAILAESGLRYFESTQTVTTTGTAAYALPADYLGTVGVDYSYQGAWRHLHELMVQERNIYSSTTSSTGNAIGYTVSGSYLTLYPTPPSGQTYRHIYVPQPTDLSASTDATSVDVVTPDGESFLVWGAVVMALAREESEVQHAIAEREAARSRVMEWAQLRSLNSARRPVVDDFTPEEDYDAADWRWRYGGF